MVDRRGDDGIAGVGVSRHLSVGSLSAGCMDVYGMAAGVYMGEQWAAAYDDSFSSP